MTSLPLRLAPEAARVIRDEVTRAGGREVSFLAEVTRSRVIVSPRAVARGNRSAVLAVARDAREGSVMIHNHPSGLLEPSDADLAVAASVYERGIGTAIVTNAADRIYVVVEPPEPRTVEPLKPAELSGLLSPDGPMATMKGYEDRRGQRSMLRFVAARFNEGGIGLVEAGTGTGKSLAYLLPAARWAVMNGERAIVSTNTINLQEQLVRKDLEIVADILGERLKWALIKGRGNYISIRRARLAAESAASLFPDDRSEELQALVEWADSSHDGSRADLPLVPGREVWEEVRSETDACLRAKCPFFQQCHYQRARRAGASADVVIVNHALFFSDLSIRIATENFTDGAVLPPYKRVIFDEAHHLEDAATPRLGAETTRLAMYRALARLDRGGKGILASVEEILRPARTSISARHLLQRIQRRTRPLAGRLRDAFDDFFDLVEPWADTHADGGSLRLGRPERPDAPATPEPAADPAVSEALETTLLQLGDLQRELETLIERLDEDKGEDIGSELQGRLLDLRSCRNRLGRADRALRLCLLPENGRVPMVRWLEMRRAGPRRVKNLAFLAAPVDLGPVLAEHLFGNIETGVLTSATMAVNGDFTYLRRRLGLTASAAAPEHDMFLDAGPTDIGLSGTAPEDIDVAESVVGSPFDHAGQSCLIVPTGLPRPGGPASSSAYNEVTADIINEVAGITNGGLFALFTSFSALRSVARSLRRSGAEARWPLYVQGESDRSRLLQAFTRSGSALLLGTSSFWEGVDVPGWPLRALVIQKLPFRVPTEPITEARVEAMTSRGENPFWGLMVPDAAVRLKQGIGRLIRTRTDRGAVLLLDDRLLTRRYGRVIREALPPLPLVRGPWEVVRDRVAEFYR
ncbi:MAG: hypothetical protein F4205_13715 [Gemmatimonadetes bacterium]|nr:hypothetical protein [Gemmatimonadota bacterium]MXX70579.1 hypothetical protein [Gemmatimonadota bacterium]MYC90017.1 hypothetical protein [Gemmatimonadota bacterium]MYG36541.1 hypothetical protein [Gemmatimonadota bacterium]